MIWFIEIYCSGRLAAMDARFDERPVLPNRYQLFDAAELIPIRQHRPFIETRVHRGKTSTTVYFYEYH